MSMSTVKLEGVGEGMFAELADNIVVQGGWLLWPMLSLWFCTFFHLGGVSGDIS